MVSHLTSLEDYVKNVTAATGFDVPLEASSDRFDWKGADAHLPPNRPFPLSERFNRKTNAPVLVLSAACMFIASRRLMSHCEVGPTVDMAEALFCFAVDPPHFNIDFEPVTLPKNTPELDASRELRVRVVKIVETRAAQKMASMPLRTILATIFFTRQIIGKSAYADFDAWLSTAIDNLDDLDPALTKGKTRFDFDDQETFDGYVDQRFGKACPFEALQPGFVRDPAAEDKLTAEYLNSLSFESNPFLRASSTGRSKEEL